METVPAAAFSRERAIHIIRAPTPGGERNESVKKLTEKLHSRRGVSILFALLLFLVCSVFGAAVLSAGVAAAGRVSSADNKNGATTTTSLILMDQRYSAVTSAANLFRNTLNGNTYELTRTMQSDAYTYVAGTQSPSDTSSASWTIKFDVSKDGSSKGSRALFLSNGTPAEFTGKEDLLTSAVLDYVFGSDRANLAAASDALSCTPGDAVSSWSKELTVSGLNGGLIPVKVRVSMDGYGNLTFVFVNNDAAADADNDGEADIGSRYVLRFLLRCNLAYAPDNHSTTYSEGPTAHYTPDADGDGEPDDIEYLVTHTQEDVQRNISITFTASEIVRELT